MNKKGRDQALELLRRRLPLAAELEAEGQDWTAWIGVYPLELEDQASRHFLKNNGFAILPDTGQAYHIRTFRIERAKILNGEWVSETDLEDPQSHFAFSTIELEQKIIEVGSSLDELQMHSKSDYPI